MVTAVSQTPDKMMEQELNYVRVKFKTSGSPARGESDGPCEIETIYDEVRTCEEQAWDTSRATPEDRRKARLLTPMHLLASGLGVICVLLVSAVITLSVCFSAVVSEQRRENLNLTAKNLQLWTEKTHLEKETQELSRERDGLNWTVGVILEHDDFPAKERCPQKVCKPCLDGWISFQSNCYKFETSNFSSEWKYWKESRDECQRQKADLVVIGSREEQEFLNKHTKEYNSDRHGYWTGLRREKTWTWVDGSNLTVTYWKTESTSSKLCGLIQAKEAPLANWRRASCTMKNRWICEGRALIKTDRD